MCVQYTTQTVVSLTVPCQLSYVQLSVSLSLI